MPETPEITSPKDVADALDHLHLKAFNNSLQANLIFNLSDGKVTAANPASRKLLGYSKKDLLQKYKKDIFDLKDSAYKKMLKEREISGSARAEISLISKSGKHIPCEISSVIFKDSNGVSNSIVSINDLRKRISIQENLDAETKRISDKQIIISLATSRAHQREKNNWIKSIVLTTYDVIWEWEIATNLISFGKTYENVFGYKLEKNILDLTDWLNSFASNEAAIVDTKLKKIFDTDENSWEEVYTLTNHAHAEMHLISRANIIRDKDRKAIRMIGVIHDRSKMQRLEGMIENGIRIKEKQIIEAIVEAKEIERSDLGMELHDNINQLLGASMLYLQMARKDLKNADIYLIHSSEYTLSAIEEIRKLTHGLSPGKKRGFKLFKEIQQTVKDTMEGFPASIHCVFEEGLEGMMSEKFKVNCCRIFQEQLNNIIKHSKASAIDIAISGLNGELIMNITDNGVGYDRSLVSEGIGTANINSRAELYKGTVSITTEPGKGCGVSIVFPMIYAK